VLTDAEKIKERVQNLSQIMPFCLLNADQLKRIAVSLKEETYPAGTFLVKQGEPSKHVLFLIIRGKAEIFVADKNGNETVTGLREAAEFLGETVFLSNKEYPASARALEKTHCYLLYPRITAKIYEESADFAAFIARLLADRMRNLYQKFSDEEEGQASGGFSKRIEDIMVTKVITCSPEDNVGQIASIMDSHNVSSVIVVNNDGKPLGIITESDLVSRVLCRGNPASIFFLTAKKLMTTGLLSLKPYDFSYQAFLLMVKHRIKHVIILDEKDKLLGIVAMRDIIKSRKTGSFAIVNNIEAVNTIKALAKLRPEVDQVLQALLVERAPVKEITSLITEFYDRITRKVIEIAEKAMMAEGYGSPPVNYCWITMGSSGRKEQFARTDQDNGIIFADVEAERKEEVKKYFLTLGGKVVAGLEQYGFSLCKGNVMANNAAWCHSFRGWCETIERWSAHLTENVRLMTIFLDFRYIYGNISLYDLLRKFVMRKTQNSSLLLFYLVKDNLSKRLPLGFFHRIQTERTGEHRNQLNLKTSACVHIVDCIRVFALKEGIPVTNTFERLDELGKRKVLNEKDIEQIKAAYETLMMLRVRDAMLKMQKGKTPDNYITPGDLTDREYSLLRESLIVVNRLQGITENIFGLVT